MKLEAVFNRVEDYLNAFNSLEQGGDQIHEMNERNLLASDLEILLFAARKNTEQEKDSVLRVAQLIDNWMETTRRQSRSITRILDKLLQIRKLVLDTTIGLGTLDVIHEIQKIVEED